MTSSEDPASVTPDPSIHNEPAADSSTNTATPTAELTEFQAWGTTLLNQVGAAIVNALEGVVTDAENAFDALGTFGQEVFDGIDTAQQAAADFTTLFEAFGASVTNATTLADFITGISNTAANALANWTTLFTDLGATASTAAELAAFLNDLSTGNFSAALAALFGSASSPGILGSIPSTAVSNITQNLQPVFDFPNSTSVSAGGQWSWSSSIDHTGTAGSGSAQCAANGTLNQLIGVPGAVQPGQTVTPQGFVTWSGLTATGSPIQLQLIPWSGTSEPGTAGTAVTPTGCEITSPGASSSTYAGAVEVDGVWWVELTGTYTVPDSGVGFVQLGPTVTAAATAGDVNFDDCASDVTGGYLANIENNLTDLQNESTESTAAFTTFLSSIESAISGYSSWSTFIAAVESAWNTYTTTESTLVSAEIFTVQQFFNSLLGISTSTGQMNASNVSSSLSLSSLEADFDTVLGWFGSPSGSTTTTELWTAVVNDIINPLNAIETQADTWWDQLLAELGISGGSSGTTVGSTITSVSSTATDGASWSTRLTNDLKILLDVFHLTYTLTQWEAAWSDLMALFGIVNSTSAATDPTPTIGPAITAASAAASTAGTNASIAIANASTVATTAQAITDGIYQSQNGGTSTGNATSTIVPSLTAIPATNIVGGTGAAVVFGAVGAGGVSGPSAGSSKTATQTHNPATGDLGVVVQLSWFGGLSGTTYSSAVTYGGVAMTLLESAQSAAATSGSNTAEAAFVQLWWVKLSAVPSGSQIVSATVSVTAGTGNLVYVDLKSMSYSASTTGAVSSASGSGSTSLSMSQSSSTDHMVVGAFAAVGSEITTALSFSGFSQTQRYNQNAGTGNVFATVAGDAAGASSVAFAVTSSAACWWAGVTADLHN